MLVDFEANWIAETDGILSCPLWSWKSLALLMINELSLPDKEALSSQIPDQYSNIEHDPGQKKLNEDKHTSKREFVLIISRSQLRGAFWSSPTATHL